MATITVQWEWVEAFDKFGFDDGDGLVMTGAVAAAIEDAGYRVDYGSWGIHNVVITSIIDASGRDLLAAAEAAGYLIGYDDPRRYLPQSLVEHLDAAFGPGGDTEP